MKKQESTFCLRCLAFAHLCECKGGPRLQRHPKNCQCSMCEQGRAIVAGESINVEDCAEDGAEE